MIQQLFYRILKTVFQELLYLLCRLSLSWNTGKVKTTEFCILLPSELKQYNVVCSFINTDCSIVNLYSKGLGLSHMLKGPKCLINSTISALSWLLCFLCATVLGSKRTRKLIQKLLHAGILSAKTHYISEFIKNNWYESAQRESLSIAGKTKDKSELILINILGFESLVNFNYPAISNREALQLIQTIRNFIIMCMKGYLSSNKSTETLQDKKGQMPALFVSTNSLSSPITWKKTETSNLPTWGLER